MKCLLWLTAALTLSACQTPHVLVRSCITAEQLEQLRQAEPPKVKDKLTGRADEDIRTIAGSNIRLRGYAHGLLDTLRVCAG